MIGQIVPRELQESQTLRATAARRWDDPSFPINFPWFGSSDYWQGQVKMLEEQLERDGGGALVV